MPPACRTGPRMQRQTRAAAPFGKIPACRSRKSHAMPRPLFATIHLDSMQHNLAQARTCAPTARIWAVVKADAYGHGLERAMRGFATADGLALVEQDAAI